MTTKTGSQDTAVAHGGVVDRVAALQRAAEIVGADAPVDQVLRIADWLATGAGIAVDPQRLEKAAAVLAQDRNCKRLGDLSPSDQNRLRGDAFRVITAYLA